MIRRQWPWWVVIGSVLAVTVVLMLVAGLLAVANHRIEGLAVADLSSIEPTDRADAEKGVLRTGKEATEALLSYRSATVAEQLAAAKDKYTTGAFRDYFTKFTTEIVVPAARDQRIDTQAAVVGIGVITLLDPSAELLVFVNQSTTTGVGDPVAATNSVRVHMVNEDGNWLVDKFDPI